MSRWQLLFSSLWFYRKNYAGVVLGMALSCAIVVGALSVGDSVKASLEAMAFERLGKVSHALMPRERFVRLELTQALQKELNLPVAGYLHAEGIVSKTTGNRQLPGVQLLGVDANFWAMSHEAVPQAAQEMKGAWANPTLAQQLDLNVGDTLIIRMEKPSLLPRDAVVNAVEDAQVSLRIPIEGILPAEQLGNFNLKVNQLAPDNLFLPLDLLQSRLEQVGFVNRVLLASSNADNAALEKAEAAFKKLWTLEDAGLDILEVPQTNSLEVRTGRIFFDAHTADVVEALSTDSAQMLTYLVNHLKVGDKKTPYAMVTAIKPAPWMEGWPAEMGNAGVWLNQWTWDDLTPNPGDSLNMAYFAVDQAGQLVTREATFSVAGAIPNTGLIDPDMMPSYPGLAGSENCRDWDTGIPIDLDEIREKDEVYWDTYKGTPKAVITLARGQEIWNNRFGNLTAVRFNREQLEAQELSDTLLRQLEPPALGLFFTPVGMMASAATSASMDFSGLFIGFSFFIIIAALLLTALLTTFSLEQRTSEVGSLMALGWTSKQVQRQFTFEVLVLCLPAAILGLGLGWLFSSGILGGLTTLWQDAVGQWALGFHFSLRAFILGTTIGLTMALLALWPTLRRFRKQSLKMLLAGELTASSHLKKKKKSFAGLFALLCFGVGFVLLFTQQGADKGNQAGIFFGAGALLLMGGLFSLAALLNRWAKGAAKAPTQLGLALGNLTRRKGRSLSIAAMIACGAFLVFSLESYRQSAELTSDQRDSGTGGFALFAQATLPIYRDLNVAVNRDQFGLDEDLFQETSLVPFRLLSGDDASCLNLNRAQQPRVLGLQPQQMAQREAFRFKVSPDSQAQPWMGISYEKGSKVVPAFVDFNTMTYSLKLKVGDTLTYLDERGDSFEIQIAGALENSLFQGSLIVDEAAFSAFYPSQSGYQWFLIDTPNSNAEALALELEQALGDQGMRVRTAAEVLDSYNQVQNTYISIFQVLGGFGLILGSLGMGILVLRNILERRSELALMRAVGFRKGTLRRLLVAEHSILFLAGLLCGMVASLVAILPKLLSPSQAIPWTTLSILAVTLLLSGCFWTWLATRLSLSGTLVQALRKE